MCYCDARRESTRGGSHKAMITLAPLELPLEFPDVEELITSNTWPYHSNPRPNAADVSAMALALPETASFWVLENDTKVGIIRLQDIDDIEDGSPVLDLRLAERVRGRGVGRSALRLLCDLSFSRWPELRRIEATTRDDNFAMQRILEVAGFKREGCLRETWPTGDGRWRDTHVYGLLRREWCSFIESR
jgi:RimJ/RimL family protein N-acetyltransferase